MPAPSIHGFSEKVALINGADDPVGRAIAIQLALNGAYVIVGYSDATAENARALAELENLGTLARAVHADVATEAGAKSLVASVADAFGRLDLLVNCANRSCGATFAEMDSEMFDRAVGVATKSTFFVTQAAVGLMESRPKPKIVNVVSALDTPETASNVLLSSTHQAIVGMTLALSKHLPAKFRTNTVAVSDKKNAGPTDDDDWLRPRLGIAADDVARTILFLLSSEGIGLNGQLLKVE
jgi:3-oxoacyl-[acyl-carrier protein] reductase